MGAASSRSGFPKLLIFCASLALAQENQLSLSGVVQHGTVPIEGATIVVRSGESAQNLQTATTDAQGVYRLSSLARRSYAIVAQAPGYSQASKQIDIQETNATADFDLTPAAPPLKFEAAGIRGLIDPGGYSVPAAAASASAVITGVTDLQRVQNQVSSKEWPCQWEAGLKKSATASGTALASRNLGEFYLAHARFQEAYPPLKTAADQLRDEHSLKLLAQAYEGSGMFSEAAQAYASAARQDPNADNLFSAAYELILAGKPAPAAAAFRDGLARNPRSHNLQLGSAAAEFLAGHTEAAIDASLRAVQLKPDDPAAYQLLALVLPSADQTHVAALAALRHYAELTPPNAKALYYYAVHLRRQNPADPEVARLLRRAIAVDSHLAEAHLEIALWYSGNGETMEAIRELEQTISIAPDLASAHYRLAQAYRSIGEKAKASEEAKAYEAARQRSRSQSDREPDLQRFISVFSKPAAQSPVALSCLERP